MIDPFDTALSKFIDSLPEDPEAAANCTQEHGFNQELP